MRGMYCGMRLVSRAADTHDDLRQRRTERSNCQQLNHQRRILNHAERLRDLHGQDVLEADLAEALPDQVCSTLPAIHCSVTGDQYLLHGTEQHGERDSRKEQLSARLCTPVACTLISGPTESPVRPQRLRRRRFPPSAFTQPKGVFGSVQMLYSP